MTHLESFYELCKDKPWSDRDGIPYVKSACKHLCRIYSTIAGDIIYKQKEDDEGTNSAGLLGSLEAFCCFWAVMGKNKSLFF